MRYLNKTLSSTSLNLALDEWLLHRCDSSEEPLECFRLWQNPVNAVILGRSSQVNVEVNIDFCRANRIEFLRRSSGGASVVIGPGCLMYSAVLDYRMRPELRMLDKVHQFVMERLQSAIENCGVQVAFQGTCDLTLNGRKFSGNSLRCQRNALLYHGTLLLNFDLDLLHSCLGNPPRQPNYRQGRKHRDFVTNLPVDSKELQRSLADSWVGSDTNYLSRSRSGNELPGLSTSDLREIQNLATSKYECQTWTFKL